MDNEQVLRIWDEVMIPPHTDGRGINPLEFARRLHAEYVLEGLEIAERLVDNLTNDPHDDAVIEGINISSAAISAEISRRKGTAEGQSVANSKSQYKRLVAQGAIKPVAPSGGQPASEPVAVTLDSPATMEYGVRWLIGKPLPHGTKLYLAPPAAPSQDALEAKLLNAVRQAVDEWPASSNTDNPHFEQAMAILERVVVDIDAAMQQEKKS